MILVWLIVLAFILLSADAWHRSRPPRPEPAPPPRRMRTAFPAARPLPPVRLADITDREERFAAAWDHARRRAFIRNPFEIGAT